MEHCKTHVRATPEPWEERERAILGGSTLEECVDREGGGFWLRMTVAQTEEIKKICRERQSLVVRLGE